jgi:hypothetical protein
MYWNYELFLMQGEYGTGRNNKKREDGRKIKDFQ